MLIPYFTGYLIHYFFNLKTKCDRKTDFRIGLYTPYMENRKKKNYMRYRHAYMNIRSFQSNGESPT